PRNTLFARDTWIAGSPSVLVAQPVAPTVVAWGWPIEKAAPPARGLAAAAALGSAPAMSARTRKAIERWMGDMPTPTTPAPETCPQRAVGLSNERLETLDADPTRRRQPRWATSRGVERGLAEPLRVDASAASSRGGSSVAGRIQPGAQQACDCGHHQPRHQ